MAIKRPLSAHREAISSAPNGLNRGAGPPSDGREGRPAPDSASRYPGRATSSRTGVAQCRGVKLRTGSERPAHLRCSFLQPVVEQTETSRVKRRILNLAQSRAAFVVAFRPSVAKTPLATSNSWACREPIWPRTPTSGPSAATASGCGQRPGRDTVILANEFAPLDDSEMQGSTPCSAFAVREPF